MDDSQTPEDFTAPEFASLWSSGFRLSDGSPLLEIEDLLFAVGALLRLGHPNPISEDWKERADELRRLEGWGLTEMTRDELESRRAELGFSTQAFFKIEQWGCRFRDGEVRIPTGTRGRDVDLFTLVVGLLWDDRRSEYRKRTGEIEYAPQGLCEEILEITEIFLPGHSWVDVQEAANRFRKDRHRYERALGGLTPPGSEMSWGERD